MKKLLVIGAGFLQDCVIRKSSEMGYKTYAVDAAADAVGFTHADCHAVIDIVDEKACLKYARENAIDGVLTAATEYGVLTASYIAEEMGLVGISYKTAQLVKDKYRVRKCLNESGADSSRLVYEVTTSTLQITLTSDFPYPVIVKPCDGSGSRGTYRIDSPEKLREACESAIAHSRTGKAVIEQFIEGTEYGAEILVTDGVPHVLAIMKKWMTKPPYYAELGHAVPCGLPAETERKAAECAEKAVRALGISTGSVNMDMVITDEGDIHIVDVGARMGGNMIGPCVIPYGTGIDYIGAMIRTAMGEKADLTPKSHRAVATRLLAFDGGIVRRLPDMAKTERDFGVEIRHHLKEGMTVNEYRNNLDGCGYIIAEARNAGEAADKAEKAQQYLKGTIFA